MGEENGVEKRRPPGGGGFIFSFQIPKRAWGFYFFIGVGGREDRGSAAFRAPKISPFTEVAATATATLRLAGNGLAFRTNSFPFFELFFSISLRSGNRFPLLCYL